MLGTGNVLHSLFQKAYHLLSNCKRHAKRSVEFRAMCQCLSDEAYKMSPMYSHGDALLS